MLLHGFAAVWVAVNDGTRDFVQQIQLRSLALQECYSLTSQVRLWIVSGWSAVLWL